MNANKIEHGNYYPEFVSPDAPIRRCRDCELNLSRAVFSALSCPLFGKKRSGVEIRCTQFRPKKVTNER